MSFNVRAGSTGGPSPGEPGSTYNDTVAPTANNDSVDTAGIGVSFQIGSFWQVDPAGTLYRCSDATSGAAVWHVVMQV